MAAALELTTVDKLRAALNDPAELLEKLDEGVGPEAKRFMIAKLRPKLAEKLRDRGLLWEEVWLRISNYQYEICSNRSAESWVVGY